MIDIVQNEWSPRTCSKIVFDRATEPGLVHKEIGLLDKNDFIYGLNNIPDSEDYENIVGGAIKFLQNPEWRLDKFIPECKLRIGTEMGHDRCYVDMRLIEGQPLDKIGKLSPVVSIQLAEFLDLCTLMADKTKKGGRIILPDLLGGVEKPYSEFRNFVVEAGTNKLYFVDLYPLASLGTGFFSKGIRRKYRDNLVKAGQTTNDMGVLSATRKLSEIIN